MVFVATVCGAKLHQGGPKNILAPFFAITGKMTSKQIPLIFGYILQ